MGPALVITEKTMPKAHPSSLYAMGLRMQHFIMHMVSTIVLMGNPFTNSARLGVQKILVTACIAVTYALVSSEFFFAASMPATQHTLGMTAEYKVPLPLAPSTMLSCMLSVPAPLTE